MADMGEMEMPLPDNTLPMMTGQGPMGALEMGGMFSVIKVRKDLARHDYRDPGWVRPSAGYVCARIERRGNGAARTGRFDRAPHPGHPGPNHGGP